VLQYDDVFQLRIYGIETIMKASRFILLATTLMTFPSSALGAERRIEKEIVVDAPRSEVWQAWTTTEGVNAFLGIQSKVENKVGGAYEFYFGQNLPEGQRGSEGCKILFTDAPELLAFTWNAPPKLAKLRDTGVRTQVFVRFTELNPKQTNVKLTHVITERGPEWDQYLAYFENAWPNVLQHLQKYFADPARKPLPTATHQVITPMTQTFDLGFPPEKVWNAFVDPNIVKQWMAPKYYLELKVGGEMKANANADAFPGDDSWIVREVLGFDPGRVLAYQNKKVPAQFPFKKAIEGTWTVMYFDPLPGNKTHFRMSFNGIKDDEESKRLRDHYIRSNPMAIEKLKAVLAKNQ